MVRSSETAVHKWFSQSNFFFVRLIEFGFRPFQVQITLHVYEGGVLGSIRPHVK